MATYLSKVRRQHLKTHVHNRQLRAVLAFCPSLKGQERRQLSFPRSYCIRLYTYNISSNMELILSHG